jgi:hypothetical protein
VRSRLTTRERDEVVEGQHGRRSHGSQAKLTAAERGARIRAGKERRRREAIERCDLVDNTALREQFERMLAREEIQVADVADLMGLRATNTTDLLRMLGIRARTGREPTT